MAKKIYSINLEEDIVERSKAIMKHYGGKLSPVIERLLLDWIEEEEDLLKKVKEQIRFKEGFEKEKKRQ